MPQTLLTLASFMVVTAGLRSAQTIVVPFLLSSFIAILAVPPLFALRKRGLHSGLALFIVLCGLLIVGTIIVSLVGSSIVEFTNSLPKYQVRLEQIFRSILDFLSEYGVDISIRELIRNNIDPNSILQVAGAALTQIGNIIKYSFLIFITIAFMLSEATSMPAKINNAFGDESSVVEALYQFVESLNQYMSIKTSISLLTGLCVTIILAVMGIDFAVLWGVVAFFLNFIPNLGSLLAAIPAVLLALVQYSVGSALGVALAYLCINVLFGNILEPRYMGKGLGISTLVVFLSLVFWAWVLGPVGMLLSVPLTMAVKIGLESREETRWIGVLLGRNDRDVGVV